MRGLYWKLYKNQLEPAPKFNKWTAEAMAGNLVMNTVIAMQH